MPSMSIEHLYISPGHNFFGRHELATGLNPLQEVAEIECIAGHGVRFFDYKVNYKGQITFFSGDVFEDVCFINSAFMAKHLERPVVMS
jgi:hypothetical protein